MSRGTMRTGGRVAGILMAVAVLLALTAVPAYAAVPTITSISPTNPTPGCQATLTGTNFQLVANGGPVTAVSFDGGVAAAPVAIDADTQLEVTVPAALSQNASHDVTLTNTSGTSVAFVFTTGPNSGTCPGVPAFSPASGAVGTTVTITGSFTTAPSLVRFNTTLTGPATTSPTVVTAVVPSGATTGPIHVYTTAGQSTSAISFIVSAGATISNFSPTSGPVGTSVTINGTNLTGATSVTFNNVAAAAGWVVNAAGTQITGAIVPASATTGPIRVVTPGGTATSTTNFTVTGAAHERTVTLQLSGHLKLSGNVDTTDGFAACENFVPVAIQRQKSGGGWKTLSLLSTDDGGHYSGFAPNKSGKYRAKAKQITLVNGVECAADTSPARKYNA